MSILFDEALEALKEVRVLKDEETKEVIDHFISSFPIQTSGNGRIDWDKIDNKVSLSSIQEIKTQVDFGLTEKCLVIWNDESHPILETTIGNVIHAFDDVTAVSFDTWIFFPKSNNVIENLSSSLKMTTFF